MLTTMKEFYFKTLCSGGITRTCPVFALNIQDARIESISIFDKFYPGHGWTLYMTPKAYARFHNL